MSNATASSTPVACPQCGTHIGSGLLSCPNCRWLVYGESLRQLSSLAQRAQSEGDLSAELAVWQQALDLLPAGSKQYDTIQQRIETLTGQLDAHPHSRRADSANHDQSDRSSLPGKGWSAGLGGLGVIGLLIWKFKFALVWIASKGKLLLTGLTKSSTLFSMLGSLGVYWAAWGWKFALGIVISIYIHEMGHVAMLRRYGIPATAPMFIPGVGAVIRSKRHIQNPIHDARVGLAGPFWGWGAAVVAYAVALGTGWPMWMAIARIGAWINLFNLIPVWQLDGAWAFGSLTRWQRWIAVAVIAAMWFATGEGMLMLILMLAIWQAATGKNTPKQPDHTGLVQYAFLIVVLSLMCLIKVPEMAN